MKPQPGLVTIAALCAALLAAPALALAQTTPPAERQTRHALIIGIGEYADPNVPELRGMRHDIASARRMAAAMAVPEANTTVLRDGAATAERIRAEIAALDARVADGDRVFVYYSGHGTRWAEAQVDGKAGDQGCIEGLLAADGQALTNVEIGQRLAPLARRADKMLVFYDACFSGGLAGVPPRTRSLLGGDDTITPKFTPKFTRAGAADACAQPSNYRSRSLAAVLRQQQALPENVVHIAASRPDELSFDSSTRGGFATSQWRDCLLGQAQDLDGSGAITVDEVTQCAQARVTRALAGQPGISGQHLAIAGNAGFVPAWMGADFAPAAAPSTAPARRATPAQILAELHGQRDGERRVVATLRQPRLKIGVDALQLDVTPARDGFLYVALAASDGQSLYLLYPNDLASDNRVRAGQRLALPGKGWEIQAAGPPGTETLLVLVSDAPRDLSGLAREKAGPFVKTLLDDQGRARLQGVLANGTPRAGCGKAGAASCSDAFGAALLTVESVR
ncbi:conserved exported hypothetical protein [Rubrivivax sp. A210]|uniref:caspase family protein n=1 Tax=Rubrivivax sp. A210 TaxID=2772301 RepID=UPI001917EA7C|nr:caspase family protein [Rubrivivax sp. A210]CAD5373268.1 conserved exported hypothetical protein [Rubrivivax sp. A210]